MAVVIASETADGDIVYVHSRSWSAVLGDGETIVAVADVEPVELHIAPPPGPGDAAPEGIARALPSLRRPLPRFEMGANGLVGLVLCNDRARGEGLAPPQ